LVWWVSLQRGDHVLRVHSLGGSQRHVPILGHPEILGRLDQRQQRLAVRVRRRATIADPVLGPRCAMKQAVRPAQRDQEFEILPQLHAAPFLRSGARAQKLDEPERRQGDAAGLDLVFPRITNETPAVAHDAGTPEERHALPDCRSGALGGRPQMDEAQAP
jgi:hypothetical protein